MGIPRHVFLKGPLVAIFWWQPWDWVQKVLRMVFFCQNGRLIVLVSLKGAIDDII